MVMKIMKTQLAIYKVSFGLGGIVPRSQLKAVGKTSERNR